MWRYTAKPLDVLGTGVNALAILPWAVCAARPYKETFWFAVAATVFFYALAHYGYTLTALARRIRCWAVGRDRSGTEEHKKGHYA